MVLEAAKPGLRSGRAAAAAVGLIALLLSGPASSAARSTAPRPTRTLSCPDADADGYAVCAGGCNATGSVCGDCNDAAPGVHPGASETCNHRDDDCDGIADEGSTRRITPATTWDPDPFDQGYFAAEAAAVGDVNGDGITDLAVTRANGLGTHGVELLSGADRTFLCMMMADGQNSPTGEQIAGIGDVNGDGVPDVATTSGGTPLNEMGEVGSMSIFSGANCSLLRTCFDPLGQPLDHLGSGFGADGRLEAFRDLTGDGIPEIAVGVPSRFTDAAGSGIVLLFSPTDCSVAARIEPPDPVDSGFFGHSLAVIPDVTGDGIADLIVGEPDWNLSRGRVHVYSGADLSLVRSIDGAPGNRTDDLLGFVVDDIADVTGDGVPDIVASAMGDDQYRGSVLIFSGATGQFVRKMFDPAGGDDEQLGRIVAAARDVTGDGLPDIVAGRLPDWSVIVFDPLTGTVAHRLSDPDAIPYFGQGVVADADLSGDGQPDLVVLNPEASPPADPTLMQVGNFVVFYEDSDCDADGSTLYEGDCSDGGVTVLPSEVQFLKFASDSLTLSWRQDNPRGRNGLLYDVLRSPFSATFVPAACLESDGADMSATDAAIPAAGTAFYYQVRAQNPCGSGSLGFTSGQVQRAGPNCP
jgi:hypothetical protein